MEIQAHTLWTNLFNNNIFESYKTERKELKITSMLITALQLELRNVYQVLELEISELNNRLKYKDTLKEKVSSSFIDQKNCPELENYSNSYACRTEIASGRLELESPDIFRNESLKTECSDISVIDISVSDEVVEKIDSSPTLISKRKKIKIKKKPKCEIIRKNVLKSLDDNSVIVDCTPEVKKMSNTRKTANLKKFKKKNNSTLTQLFTDLYKRDTVCEKKSKIHSIKSNETGKKSSIDDDATKIGITQLLNFVNEDTPNKDDTQQHKEDKISSKLEVDEFSKALLFDNSLETKSSPKEKIKVLATVEPVVRGHARKLLKGFSCAQCRDFYGSMNLSPEELQKKLDECSKHRYKYQPPDDTYPGIWDMSIPDENRF
ncbi:uncharacterized protein LOC130893818 [Diorhabda carinulata]|uniref:uncharacterized protein LOC130893818 n=1 Tax=Diorhabda carinulata TaxID=1163345 RepID=UPI0025A1AB2C|nr:uncharacterized protein LOC130893818 [Diorhabda carinulata]